MNPLDFEPQPHTRKLVDKLVALERWDGTTKSRSDLVLAYVWTTSPTEVAADYADALHYAAWLERRVKELEDSEV